MPAPRRADIGCVPVNSTEFARWVVDSLESGLLAVDANARIMLLNRQARELLGLAESPPDAWLGRDVRECLVDHPPVARLLVEALEGREGPSRAELVLPASQEAPTRVVGFTLQAVCDHRGPIGASLLFRDLTPFEDAGERERLRDRLAALGEMAAGMAHEIRNPLAGMEVLTGLLRRRIGSGDPESLDLLRELTGELRALARVVDTSLDYVKSRRPAREACDPIELLESSLERALKRIEFSGQIDRCFSDAPSRLWADPEQLQVVLTDLILNALHAMQSVPSDDHRLALEIFTRPERGNRSSRRFGDGADSGAPWQDAGDEIEILESVSGSGLEIVFCVQDTGPGVPGEYRHRIFYPFFTTREGGSGVGLATAQKLVAAHAGSIRLESPCDGGARFQVAMPLLTARDGGPR